MKMALGLALGFAIGFLCNYFQKPCPAPPALFGAGLVVSITLGYELTDRMLNSKKEAV